MVATQLRGFVMRSLGVAALAAAIFFLNGCGDVHSRSDFMAAAMNKSDQDVKTALGKPDAVDDRNPERVTWTYNHATFDLENQDKMDSKTIVVFRRDAASGKLTATQVLFE